MQAAHSDVVNALHMASEVFRRLRRLLRYRNIRRSCRTDGDLSDVLLSFLFNFQNPGDRIVADLRQRALYQLVLLLRRPGAEHLAFLLIEPFENGKQMRIRLSAAEHHLRETGA